MEEERLFPIDIHYNKLLGEVALNQIFHDSARSVISVLQGGNPLKRHLCSRDISRHHVIVHASHVRPQGVVTYIC